MILVSCDPALVPLFTPPHPRLGRYEVCASSEPIQALNGGPIEALEALDAFGSAGTYDRPALARLFGGTRVQVARGWRGCMAGPGSRSHAVGREPAIVSSRLPDCRPIRMRR